MKLKYVSGIPLALFDNFVSLRANRAQKGFFYVLRFNSSLEDYFESVEFIEEYSYTGLLHTLNQFGFERVKDVTKVGEFAVKGDTIIFWQPGMSDPVKIEYFGDQLEEINTIDMLTGRKIARFTNMPLFKVKELLEKADLDNIKFIAPEEREGKLQFAEEIVIWTNFESQMQFGEDSERYDLQPTQLYFGRFDLLEKDIEKYKKNGYKIAIFTKHQSSLPHTLQTYTTHKLPSELPLEFDQELEMGFVSEQFKYLLITDRELFGTIFVSARQRHTLKSTEAQKLLSQLEGEIEIGDYIVHEDHGVGIYKGFVLEDGSEYLKIAYAENDELFVPLDQINKLTKFIGESGQKIEITRLGKGLWQALKTRVKKEVAIAAKELARHYANIKLASAQEIEQHDSEDYKNFLDKFPYEPTPDQLKAERDIISDMMQKKPMNRLLIGDVGFGKTEIMLRAAFKMVEAGKQVVILCPTTVLALQHNGTFTERFKDFPVNVAFLSRFQTAAENKTVIEKVNEGKIDIVIGTHRMLTSDFQPKKMGLLIVDEEQKFGVKQKEKIRKLEYGVHTLYVSATPIPRTLSMALSAIKDISLIQTPPKGRKPVTTEVSKLNWGKAVQAIDKEINRGGQVVFVHNQVQTIASVFDQLQQMLPKVRFAVAHGQMNSQKLDDIMTDFYHDKIDCLIATTIIENGLDIPNANTIIVNNSQNLGLAQMYQLRGRVGRSERQAYAYFFYKGRELPAEEEIEQVEDEEEVKKLKPQKYIERLETILNSQELGSGFKIASRDLEIRGAGNLLGREQSGNISKVGYGLYMQMLAEEIERLKNIAS